MSHRTTKPGHSIFFIPDAYDNYSLTKREYFSSMFLAALIPGSVEYPSEEERRCAVKSAIEYADILIQELNRLAND